MQNFDPKDKPTVVPQEGIQPVEPAQAVEGRMPSATQNIELSPKEIFTRLQGVDISNPTQLKKALEDPQVVQALAPDPDPDPGR